MQFIIEDLDEGSSYFSESDDGSVIGLEIERIPGGISTDGVVLSVADVGPDDGNVPKTGLVTALKGSTSGTLAEGNDPRLSDSRTPTAHAASHGSAGADKVNIPLDQITQSGAIVGQVPRWDGAAWTPDAPASGSVTSVAGVSPSGGDVPRTDLVTELNGAGAGDLAPGDHTHAYADLTDVDVSTPPTDGQVPTWDTEDSTWKPATPSGGGGGGDLDDLGDVDAPSPNDGDSLVWDSGSSMWVPVAVPVPPCPDDSFPSYVWDGDSYEITCVRRWAGPADPDGEGFTVLTGEIWDDPS
jgi:hypothetical protein